MFTITNDIWELSLQQSKPLEIGAKWVDTGSRFALYSKVENDTIDGIIHSTGAIETLIRVMKHYNTCEGAYHALVYEMVIEGMVSRNPEKHESCLNSCDPEVCADICPPEKCEHRKGGGS